MEYNSSIDRWLRNFLVPPTSGKTFVSGGMSDKQRGYKRGAGLSLINLTVSNYDTIE
jgi:hypothetical protein